LEVERCPFHAAMVYAFPSWSLGTMKGIEMNIFIFVPMLEIGGESMQSVAFVLEKGK